MSARNEKKVVNSNNVPAPKARTIRIAFYVNLSYILNSMVLHEKGDKMKNGKLKITYYMMFILSIFLLLGISSPALAADEYPQDIRTAAEEKDYSDNLVKRNVFPV